MDFISCRYEEEEEAVTTLLPERQGTTLADTIVLLYPFDEGRSKAEIHMISHREGTIEKNVATEETTTGASILSSFLVFSRPASF